MSADDMAPGTLASTPLTPEERRAGYRRLAVVSVALVVIALLAGLVFIALGAEVTAGLAAGIGLVGILMVIGGVFAFSRTGSVRRAHGDIRFATADERRAAERLALGLLAGGILFSVISMAVA